MSETAPIYPDDQAIKRKMAAAREAKARRGITGPKVQRSLLSGSKLLAGIDGRSQWVRRCKDLLREHTQDLGGVAAISAGERSLVRRIAVVTVELEYLETRFAAAETGADPKDFQLYLTAANNLRRLLEAIGLQRRARDVTPDPLSYAREQSIVIDADPIERGDPGIACLADERCAAVEESERGAADQVEREGQVMFFTDAYTDQPRTQRGRLAEEVRRLKAQSWADPGDADLRERVAEAEAALAAYDARSK